MKRNMIHRRETSDLPADAVVISRIEIVRYLTNEEPSDGVMCSALDSEGHQLPLVESLGLLRITEDTLIRMETGETGEDDEDEGA